MPNQKPGRTARFSTMQTLGAMLLTGASVLTVTHLISYSQPAQDTVWTDVATTVLLAEDFVRQGGDFTSFEPTLTEGNMLNIVGDHDNYFIRGHNLEGFCWEYHKEDNRIQDCSTQAPAIS